jgi:hypothetical protein
MLKNDKSQSVHPLQNHFFPLQISKDIDDKLGEIQKAHLSPLIGIGLVYLSLSLNMFRSPFFRKSIYSLRVHV